MTPTTRVRALGLLVSSLAFLGCESPFGTEDTSAANARGQGRGGDEPKDGDQGKPALKACPEVGTTVLYGGQHIEVGYVDARIVDGKLSVKLVGKDWTFTEVHVDVATSAGGLHGSPGQMLHNSGRLSYAGEYATTFDLAALGWDGRSPMYIATYAVAHGLRNGQDAAETSWGYGTRYGEGWGWYFSLPNSLCQGGSGSIDSTGGSGTAGSGSGSDSGTGTGTGTVDPPTGSETGTDVIKST